MDATLQPSQRQQALDLLRFPLAVVVLIIHTWNLDGLVLQGDPANLQNFPFFQEFTYLIEGFLRHQSVPIYFFISGFVFFFNVEWSGETYRRKLKNRVKTLLIPYLIWNAAAIGIVLAGHLPLFDGIRAHHTDIHFSLKALLACFWNYNSDFFPQLNEAVSSGSVIAYSYPINVPLWFLRNLMIVVVCTPLLYRILKYAKSYAVIGLGLLWFFLGYLNAGYLYQLLTGFFFFAWGAYLSINRKDMLKEFGRYFKLSMYAYPLLGVFYVVAMHYWPEAAFTIKRLNILAGLLFAYNLAAWLLKRNICRPNAFLAASSFFIYVSHHQVCKFMTRILSVLLRPESDIALLTVYSSAIILTLALLLGIFYLMKRYTPGVLKVIAGRQ